MLSFSILILDRKVLSLLQFGIGWDRPGWCGELPPRTVNLPKKNALPPFTPLPFLLPCPRLLLLPQFQSLLDCVIHLFL